MDILRVLSSPDPEVRKKTLQLVLDLVTSRNIHEVEKVEACGSKISLVFFPFKYTRWDFSSLLLIGQAEHMTF